MGPATDCDGLGAVGSWIDMRDFDDLKQRIQALCARAAFGPHDSRLLVEIEDLLAEGYVCALRGDHRSRRLQQRVEALVEAAEAGEQLRAVASEQRMISQATRELRSQLAVMREHWVALGSERLGLA
jgi:hypothetical protein